MSDMTPEIKAAMEDCIRAFRAYLKDDTAVTLHMRELYRAMVAVETLCGVRSIHLAKLGRELQRQGVLAKS